MSFRGLCRQIGRGIHALMHGRAADQDVTDEVQHYLDEATAAFVATGMSPDEARRAARAACGNATAIREEVRGSGWERIITAFIADLRYASRGLRNHPGFTLVAVLTLALGIGASTAIFSAVEPILFAPLPYPQGSRLVLVLENNHRTGGTFAMFETLATRSHAFSSLAVLRPWQPTLTGTGQPEQFEGERVSADYFRVLGVPPVVGRDFTAVDDRVHGPPVVMLSDSVWRRRFDGDPGIVGHAIHLNDNLFTVVGVMPAGFENVLAPDVEIWTTLQYDPSLPANGREWGHQLTTIGRLAPGVAVSEAGRDTHTIGRAMIDERHPETYGADTQFSVTALHDDLVSGVAPALVAVTGAVLLVLVIACVNVTNLLLARGARRRGEFRLRVALGAGRGRLVRQLLAESLLLALAGGAAGMATAVAGVRALAAVTPAGLLRAGAIRVDAAMFIVGAAMSTLVGLACGLVPALQATSGDPHPDMPLVPQRTTGGGRRTRRALVVTEVALALVLLVGAGLLLRSLNRLFAIPPGFDGRDLLTMQVQLVGHRYDDPPATYRFFEQALNAVRDVPGVTAAGFTSQLPLSGDHDEYGARFDVAQGQPAKAFSIFRYAVEPGYLEAARIPLLRGRTIESSDRTGAPPVAVISQTLARKRFGDSNPLGQTVRLGPSVPYTIVGVVGDVRQVSLALTDADAVYISAAQSWFADHTMSLVVRGQANSAPLAAAIERAVRAADKDQPITRVRMIDDLLAASESARRFALTVFEAFGGAALVLAAIGLYGILAGGVAERAREIGIRAALGASREDIVTMIVEQGMTLTAVGVAIGLAAAVLASRVLITLLFGVSPLDPITYLGVVILLFATSGVACALPAWRAAHVDPSIALRSE